MESLLAGRVPDAEVYPFAVEADSLVQKRGLKDKKATLINHDLFWKFPKGREALQLTCTVDTCLGLNMSST